MTTSCSPSNGAAGGGNTLGVVMTLTLDGEMVNATQDLDFWGGQVSISGTGEKQ